MEAWPADLDRLFEEVGAGDLPFEELDDCESCPAFMLCD
jgi:hypothetical protein